MINDYSTLQDAVAQWLARADLAVRIPDFIQLAETRINRDLRTAPQQTALSGTTVGGQVPLPSDFRQMQAFIIQYGGYERELDPVPPQQSLNGDMRTCPSAYYITGSTLNVIGSDDYAYRMVYFAGVPGLSDASPQNWLILNDPTVYLYATLLEACPYLRDDQRTQLYGSGYQNAIDGLRRQDDYVRYAPSPRQRVDFITA